MIIIYGAKLYLAGLVGYQCPVGAIFHIVVTFLVVGSVTICLLSLAAVGMQPCRYLLVHDSIIPFYFFPVSLISVS